MNLKESLIRDVNVDLSSLDEFDLAAVAENHFYDDVADRAMKLLREKYDTSYRWCHDCDGLVINNKTQCPCNGYEVGDGSDITSPKP